MKIEFAKKGIPFRPVEDKERGFYVPKLQPNGKYAFKYVSLQPKPIVTKPLNLSLVPEKSENGEEKKEEKIKTKKTRGFQPEVEILEVAGDPRFGLIFVPISEIEGPKANVKQVVERINKCGRIVCISIARVNSLTSMNMCDMYVFGIAPWIKGKRGNYKLPNWILTSDKKKLNFSSLDFLFSFNKMWTLVRIKEALKNEHVILVPPPPIAALV